MRRLNAYRRVMLLLIGGVFACLISDNVAYAQSFGVNWQHNNPFGFGPWFVSDFGPAFGVAGDDWYNTPSSSSVFDANSVGGIVSFSSPSMSGASANLAWSASNVLQGSTYAAYGWSHANEPSHPSNGVPQNGEEAVMSAFMFAEYNPVSGQGGKIQVRISNLNSIATAASVPLNYQVKLIASCDWQFADNFTPALIQSSSGQSETANFTLVDLNNDTQPDHPRWNEAYFSSGAVANSALTYTGDTLTVTLAGPNEFGTWGQPGYGRTTLSGIAVYFVAPVVVPEPVSLMTITIGISLVAAFYCRSARRRGTRGFQSALRKLVLVSALGCVSSTASAVSPSFGINFDNHYFNNMTAANFPSAFGVAGQDWFGTLLAVSDDHAGASAAGVVTYSAPSFNGASVGLKWTSDRYWGGSPSPVYGFTHANVDLVTDPTGQTGLQNAGTPLSGEEAVLKGSLISTYIPSAGIGEKIQVTVTGLNSVATTAGVPLKYQVKVMASDWGLPRSFYLPPFGSTNPNPGFEIGNYSSATVADNAAHSEVVDLSIWDDPNPTSWNPPPIDPQGPYYSSAATGDSTTVFTGDTLTITLDGAFDYGGAWGTSTYGVTRLAGVAIYFVNPGQTGDFDGDGDVDGADFIVWQTNFPTTSGAGLGNGDADSDGDVDGADFAAWQSNFPTAPGPGNSPVPEPSAVLLMIVGLIGAVSWRLKCS